MPPPKKEEILTPEIKDLIGQLAIATAKSTDPAHDLKLTSSRISFDMAAMKIKSREKVSPGLFDVLHESLLRMIQAMMFDEFGQEILAELKTLEQIVQKRTEETSDTFKYNTIESMEIINDYNLLLECRNRWKIASDTYMQNHDAWAKSNKMLGDIHDVLTRIEIRYGLIAVPKNISWDVNDMVFSKKRAEEENGSVRQ